jgi:hypothetical protein
MQSNVPDDMAASRQFKGSLPHFVLEFLVQDQIAALRSIMAVKPWGRFDSQREKINEINATTFISQYRPDCSGRAVSLALLSRPGADWDATR